MKRLNDLAKEINRLLLSDESIKEYLILKEEIINDSKLSDIYNRLDSLRKDVCKNKEKDSSEYYNLLEQYENDCRVKRYKVLKKEVEELFFDISDILSLK